jgi:hypothetical protein
MKFEIEFGYFGNNKLIIETHDFEMVEIFQKFVEFQENHGWAVEYEAVTEFDDEEDEEVDDEEIDEDDEPITVSTYLITKIEE